MYGNYLFRLQTGVRNVWAQGEEGPQNSHLSLIRITRTVGLVCIISQNKFILGLSTSTSANGGQKVKVIKPRDSVVICRFPIRALVNLPVLSFAASPSPATAAAAAPPALHPPLQFTCMSTWTTSWRTLFSDSSPCSCCCSCWFHVASTGNP